MKYFHNNVDLIPDVQLFILSRDRLDFCRETVTSALAQTSRNYQVIVSDNSENDDVSAMLNKEFPQVKLIRRRPTLSALDHINSIINEAISPLVVLFHDDDVLRPEYISRMTSIFENEKDLVAIGCDAYLIRQNDYLSQSFMKDFNENKLITKPIELLEPYLTLSQTGPAPFPGYMYRTDKIKEIKMNNETGGKYSDVTFLLRILSEGKILWVAEKLFAYRFHSNNDSNVEVIGDRLRCLRYIYKLTKLNSKSEMIREFKFIYWQRWIRQQKKISFLAINGKKIFKKNRYMVIYKFVFGSIIKFGCNRLNTWKLILRYIFNRMKLYYVFMQKKNYEK